MKLIVAVDKKWGIGKDNQLLVHLSGDLKYFKERTLNKTVVMGRATLESLPGGKPLPKRTNIVITGNVDYTKEGCVIVHSVSEAISAASEFSKDDVVVMGGASVYTQMLPYCDTCYITKIDETFPADKHFPNLDEDKDFEVVWESPEQEENGITYRFLEYKRIK